ncbi:MAG: propionyl-CoA synthetase [Arenicella sp.]|jgi:propionyl-CoA synthetase
MTYASEYELWNLNPEAFWKDKARDLDWFKFPEKILSNDAEGLTHWFADGELNTCYLALDWHVENGRGNQTALIYDSPVTGTKTSYSYKELLLTTSKTAGLLQDIGVKKGDTVIIYMPMIPEAAIAMLACARIGAIHSVVFGGFAASELASRINDAKPKIILSASCGIEINRIIEYKPLLDQAINQSSYQPEHCVIFQRKEATADMQEGRDIDWYSALKNAPETDPVKVSGNDPLYILYTSGTTGKPKGVVRTNGGHAVAMKYSMSAIYGMQPGDTFLTASDIGWVVGHSYIVYAPLIAGCTTVFYEGKPIMTPDAGAFWRLIEEYKVNALFSAPTAFRAIRREDADGLLIKQYDISSLRHVFAAGERLDPSTQEWMRSKIGVDIIDNWWQTETGWPIASNMTGFEKLPIKFGSATKPTPGYHIQILNDHGDVVENGVQGNVAIKLPLPPGCLTTLWNDDDRFKSAYLSDYPGYYTSGDGGYFDNEGYLYVMGRVDDVINIAGHRLSTGDIEEVLGKHEGVAECAVVALVDELKGEIPVGFIVPRSSDDKQTDSERLDLSNQLQNLIRNEIGAIACYKKTFVVSRLPKTRSGKILRKTIKQILNKQEYSVPPTIEDPITLEEIIQVTSPN